MDRGRVGMGLEGKIRAAGRPWTVGDIAMVADGQWAVGVQVGGGREGGAVVGKRVADGRSVELTLEELARAVDPHLDDDTGEGGLPS
ncbi:hypothetical protein [Streptomyces buecherae]|uniref:hypothetical protein n=1 Tax=Streptomyces buecherae TaxID=2763006 RepID=UPI0037AF21F9